MYVALPASDKISSFLPWGWLIDRSPGHAFLIMLFASPLFMMFVLNPFVEGRLVLFRDQFLTFRMDVMFAPTLGCGLVLVGAMDNHVYVPRSLWWTVVQVLILVFWIGFGLWHMWQERHDYTWAQRLSPSALYHNAFLFGFVGYALTVVGGIGLVFAPWSFELIVIRVVMLGCITVWGLSWPLWDEKHKVASDGQSKYAHAHVHDGWPWQHGYEQLASDWRLFVADVRGLPGRLRRRLARVFAA